MFWWFMFISNMIISVLLIFFGGLFIKNPPKKINKGFGYRTKRSMANIESWNLAHKTAGGVLLKSGVIMTIINIIVMLILYGKDTNLIGYVGGGLSVITILAVFLTIPVTEKKLKEAFTE